MYIITRLDTGRRYVGVKLFTRRITKPPLKGKKRKRRSVQESDWESYWGSNEELIREVQLLGEDSFKREIVKLCPTKAVAKYEEAKLQFELDVLRHPDLFYNQFIGVKIHRSHLKNL